MTWKWGRGVPILGLVLALGIGGCSSDEQQKAPSEQVADEGGNGNNLDANLALQSDNQELQGAIGDLAQAPPPGGAGVANAVANAVANVPAVDPGLTAAGGGAPATSSVGGLITGTAGAPAAEGLPEMGSKMVYFVKNGDTLGKISTRIFGTPKQWRQLAKWSNIHDPNTIYPGDVVHYQLTSKSLAFAKKYEKKDHQRVAVVLPGETINKLAKRIYGSADMWRMVWRENAQIVNPDNLIVGMQIYYTNDSTIQTAAVAGKMASAKAYKAKGHKVATTKTVKKTISENGTFMSAVDSPAQKRVQA